MQLSVSFQRDTAFVASLFSNSLSAICKCDHGSRISQAYKDIFVDAEEKLPEILRRLDPGGTGEVDYVEWSKVRGG